MEREPADRGVGYRIQPLAVVDQDERRAVALADRAGPGECYVGEPRELPRVQGSGTLEQRECRPRVVARLGPGLRLGREPAEERRRERSGRCEARRRFSEGGPPRERGAHRELRQERRFPDARLAAQEENRRLVRVPREGALEARELALATDDALGAQPLRQRAARARMQAHELAPDLVRIARALARRPGHEPQHELDERGRRAGLLERHGRERGLRTRDA